MRGADTFTESLSTMQRLDDFVPKSHPLRPIRTMVKQTLAKMDRLLSEPVGPGKRGISPPYGSLARAFGAPAHLARSFVMPLARLPSHWPAWPYR